MIKPKPNLLLMVAIAIFGTAVVFDIAYGQDHGCQGGHNCNDSGEVTNVLTGGDNAASIAGSRAYGFGGSDVDINDGYRSYSYLFGLIQETKSNPLELGRQLMAEGNYEGAAILRCQPWGIHRSFGSKDKCIAVLSRPPTAIAPVIVKEPDKDEDERLDALRADLESFKDQIAQAKEGTRKARIEAQKASAVAQTAQTAPDDGALRRARAKAAHQKAKEDYQKED